MAFMRLAVYFCLQPSKKFQHLMALDCLLFLCKTAHQKAGRNKVLPVFYTHIQPVLMATEDDQLVALFQVHRNCRLISTEEYHSSVPLNIANGQIRVNIRILALIRGRFQ